MTASLRQAAQQALAALMVLSDDDRCSAHSWDDSYASEAVAALQDALGAAPQPAEPKTYWSGFYNTSKPAAVERVPAQVDWQAVGRIIEAHQDAKQRHVAGTTNWGAAIWKAAYNIKGAA